MHDLETMMAIIVASTTLTGLAGVVIGQIKNSGLSPSAEIFSRYTIVVCFFLSVMAVLSAISWLCNELHYLFLLSLYGFEGQLFIFTIVTSLVWVFKK